MAKFCSSRCGTAFRNSRKFNGKVEGTDYIKCPICHQKVAEISILHAKMHGFGSVREMASKFGLSTLKCKNVIKRMEGSGNPGFNHGGALSPWSPNNPNLTSDQLKQNWLRAEEARVGKRPNEKAYWTAKGYSEEDAGAKVRERQQTFSLDICIKKYGEDAGLRRWTERQTKWLKSCPNRSFSMVSQELFWAIVDRMGDRNSFYFATKTQSGQRSTDDTNHELRLTLSDRAIMPDFIDTAVGKIIEFDGDYWHSESKANPLREAARDASLKEAGYQVLHVAEHDYRSNPEEVINKCINFLS